MIRKYINIKDVIKELNDFEAEDAVLILEAINVSKPLENYLLTMLLSKSIKVKNGENLIYLSKGELVDYIVIENKKQDLKKVHQVMKKGVVNE